MMLTTVFTVMPLVWGYIDPASGSLATQLLLAALVSGGFLLRNFLLRPFSWFRVRRSADQTGSSES